MAKSKPSLKNELSRVLRGPGFIEKRPGHPEDTRWSAHPPSIEEIEERGGYVLAWCQLLGGVIQLCRFTVRRPPARSPEQAPPKRGVRVIARDFNGKVYEAEDIIGCVWPLRPPEAVR